MWKCINTSLLVITPINGKLRSGTPASGCIYKRKMNAYKPVPVVNLPPVRFIGGL